MVPVKIYRMGDYPSLDAAEKDGAVYNTEIDDCGGLTSVFFRDVLYSISNVADAVAACLGTEDIAVLVEHPETGKWVTPFILSEWSYNKEHR